jgi:hypothetical protein
LRTIAYNNIVYAAAEASGGYTRDKIPATVAVLLHGYLTESARDVIRRKHCSTWPELLTITNLTATTTPVFSAGVFANTLGTGGTEAIICNVYDVDPTGSAAAYRQDFENIGASVLVESDITSCYVESMDYPPNYTNMTQGQRDAATVLERMSGWLIYSAGAKLAAADGRDNMAAVCRAMAQAALKREVDESGSRGRHATVLRN